MNVFAIRHKPSGFFLPPPFGRNGRGGSQTEPAEGLPRLFPKRRNADYALRAWLEGKFVRSISPLSDWSDEEESIDVVPQPHRKATEMEIVEFSLVEVKNGGAQNDN